MRGCLFLRLSTFFNVKVSCSCTTARLAKPFPKLRSSECGFIARVNWYRHTRTKRHESIEAHDNERLIFYYYYLLVEAVTNNVQATRNRQFPDTSARAKQTFAFVVSQVRRTQQENILKPFIIAIGMYSFRLSRLAAAWKKTVRILSPHSVTPFGIDYCKDKKKKERKNVATLIDKFLLKTVTRN